MARVLIVDDNEWIRIFIKDCMKLWGHEVVGEAADGSQAIDQYVKCQPDIVTLDMSMPKKDGLSALTEIIAIDPYAKVIICTAIRSQQTMAESINRGAKDFIIKPFTLTELENSVANILG
jgi:two-component system chemotaxis response regulator CheY